MKLDRKTFLRHLGAGAIGLAAAGTLRAEKTASPAPRRVLPPFNPARAGKFWREVRAQFPLLDDPLYLNTGGLGPASRPVLELVEATMRKLQEHSETGHNLIAPARESVARFFGAKPQEICFTRNATEGNSIIAAGLPLQPGDEVIFETHAHPGGSFPWLNQAKQRGVKVLVFEPDNDSPEGNLARIRALVTARTKVIQVSHITCTTGLVMPVQAIGEFARDRGIWFHLDGAQYAGMLPLRLNELACDSYAVSGHKWLGGPHETGVFYLRRDRLEAVAPTGIGAHSGSLAQLPGELEYVDDVSRHEYGSRNAGLILGLAEAVRFQEQIGVERIAAHGRELATLLLNELGKVKGITVLTPRHDALRASMTTIRHDRADAGKLFGYLLEKHRLRCRPVTEQGLNAVRISTHVFNSTADCERVIAGVRASARDL